MQTAPHFAADPRRLAGRRPRSAPTAEQWADAELAWRICGHVKSNSIVLVKDGQAVGIGAGPAEPGRGGRDRGEEGRRPGEGRRVRDRRVLPVPRRRRGRGVGGCRGGGPARRRGASDEDDHRPRRRARPRDGLHRRTALPALMAAVMMPGAPVAEAVFADLEPRIKALREAGHSLGLGTILVGDDSASEGYIRMKQHKAAELGFNSPHIHLPRRRDPGRPARRDPRVQRRPRGRRLPRAAPDPAADRLRRRAARDRSRQGRRRAAPGERRPARAVDARPGAVHARGDRGAARVLRDPGRRPRGRASSGAAPRSAGRSAILLSQKRPTANAAVTVVHTGVPDWPALHAARRDRRRRRRRARASCSPSTSRRARSSSAAACATRAQAAARRRRAL